MEYVSETQRYEEGAVPRDFIVFTPETVALQGLVDKLGVDKAKEEE